MGIAIINFELLHLESFDETLVLVIPSLHCFSSQSLTASKQFDIKSRRDSERKDRKNHVSDLGPSPFNAEEILQRRFTLFHSESRHQMFSVCTIPEKILNTTITGHFRFVFVENFGREVT